MGNAEMYVIITNLSVGACYTISSKARTLKISGTVLPKEGGI